MARISDAMMRPGGDIRARVHFFAEGGRAGPTPPEFLGCIFSLEGELFDCRLYLHEVGSVAPGQTVEIPIAFLYRDLVLRRFRVGGRFFLRDMRLIAEGEVSAILAD